MVPKRTNASKRSMLNKFVHDLHISTQRERHEKERKCKSHDFNTYFDTFYLRLLRLFEIKKVANG